eukprot:GEMP01026499.1.p1 GENE.GEMP01026499.1~~GEMP01026499.1.p1  ORF type:complete len:339 (+),score=72.97 GEMP01026499.1:336-1352(+)
MDREVFAFVVDIMRRWAIFLGVPATELVNFLPCTNVTTALSTVTRSWIKSGWHGKVVHLDVAYGTTKKVLRYAAEQTDSRCVEVPTVFDDAAIIRALEEYCVDAAFVVLDHITSNTAAALPIQDMIQAVRRVSPACIIFVDGAHAAGPTMMENLYSMYRGSDFWATNGHKWMCGPKGTAALYRNPNCNLAIEPLVISHGFEADNVSGFYWQGAQDFTSFLALDATFAFWDKLNVGTAGYYNNCVLIEAANLLMDKWGTKLLAPEKFYTTMALVKLPVEGRKSYDDAEWLQDKLFHKGIVVPIKCVNGELYVRLSTQIYNELDDYEALLDAIDWKNTRE